MSQEEESTDSLQEDDELDAWIDRTLQDVLDEAENEGFFEIAKGVAEERGWIEPKTPAEYLMWFETLLEETTQEAFYTLKTNSIDLYRAHHLAGYAAELRCFGIQAAPRPWESGILLLDPEILEGLRTVAASVSTYGHQSSTFIGHIYPQKALQAAIAAFNKLEISDLMPQDDEGHSSTVLMVRNLAEQFSFVAVCVSRNKFQEKSECLKILNNIWDHASYFGCPPKEIVMYSIKLWNYRVSQQEKGKTSDLDAECAIILPGKEPVFESPIEEMFWKAWKEHCGIRLIPQHEIGKYRVDFAHLSTKIAIELDGLVAHQTTEQIAKDRKRQREIEAIGWKVIRFGGKEIYHSVQQCVIETEKIIRERLQEI